MSESTEEMVKRVLKEEAKPLFAATELALQRKVTERVALEVKLRKETAAKQELQRRGDKLVKEVETKDVELANLTQEKKVYQKKLTDKDAELATAQEIQDSLKDEVVAVKKRLDPLERQLKETKRNQKEQAELLEAEKVKNIASSKEIEDLKSKLAAVNDENTDLSKEVVDFQAKNTTLSKSLAEKEREIRTLRQEAHLHSDKGKGPARVENEGAPSSRGEKGSVLDLVSDEETHKVDPFFENNDTIQT